MYSKLLLCAAGGINPGPQLNERDINSAPCFRSHTARAKPPAFSGVFSSGVSDMANSHKATPALTCKVLAFLVCHIVCRNSRGNLINLLDDTQLLLQWRYWH